MICAIFVQLVCLIIVTILTKWDKEVSNLIDLYISLSFLNQFLVKTIFFDSINNLNDDLNQICMIIWQAIKASKRSETQLSATSNQDKNIGVDVT